jgi:hypothetical protein
MRVLVLEGEQGAAAAASAELEAAGHEVARCYDGERAIPCHGMEADRQCPLESGAVDVALLARDAGREPLVGGEDGARCALRRFVPLVVAGDGTTPYADWATGTVVDGQALVDVLERARQAPLTRHADAARRSMRAVLEQHGLDGSSATADVVRDGPDLRVRLRAAIDFDRKVADMASVRVVGAVRDIDPYPRVIDVSFEV